MEYDVFISYRREGGYDKAKHLNDLLTRDGYSEQIRNMESGNINGFCSEKAEALLEKFHMSK